MINFKIILVNLGGKRLLVGWRAIYCAGVAFSSGLFRFLYYTVRVWKSTWLVLFWCSFFLLHFFLLFLLFAAILLLDTLSPASLSPGVCSILAI